MLYMCYFASIETLTKILSSVGSIRPVLMNILHVLFMYKLGRKVCGPEHLHSYR